MHSVCCAMQSHTTLSCLLKHFTNVVDNVCACCWRGIRAQNDTISDVAQGRHMLTLPNWETLFCNFHGAQSAEEVPTCTQLLDAMQVCT